jgi:uncharacterized protein YkwD
MLRTLLTPTLVLALTAGPLLAVGATAPAVAGGRHQPTVTVAASNASPTAGDRLRFRGSVSGPSRGAGVRLQQQQDSRWRVVARGTVKRSGGYRLAVEAVEEVATYRVQVLKNKRLRRASSPPVEVVGQAEQGPPLSFYTLRRLRLDLGELIDTFRDDRGLGRLSPDSRMHDYAQKWSVEQAGEDTVLVRDSFEDAPEEFEVSIEHTMLSGTPREAMAELEATATDLLNAEALWLGVGMSRRDDDTGFWTVTLATDAPEPGPMDEQSVRLLILEQTNDYRAEHGLAPLAMMDGLTSVAQGWSQHMADHDDFRHNPGYSQQYPPGWSRAGENIAKGFSEHDVVDAWYRSPGHQANMLGDYTHIGIGFARPSDGADRRFYTQNFARY